MSGTWRVTVDSWISPDATWYGTATYVVSGEHVHSLPAALTAIAESPPEVYLNVARSVEGRGPAPEATVPVCDHGRGRSHDDCPGPVRPEVHEALLPTLYAQIGNAPPAAALSGSQENDGRRDV